jgi:hypothetical protein
MGCPTEEAVMFNWFDLMRQAQTSGGFDALAQQYGLSPDQAQKAMAAFLPAFAMGLQRTANPNDPGQFVQSMMNQAYQSFWQMAGQSFSTQAQQQGRQLLDRLFGSDEVTRRVAHQAADYAGVSVETMRQVLPVLTGILAGGMYQWMAAQGRGLQTSPLSATPQQGSERGTDPWAELWAIWTKGAEPEKKPASHPFEDVMASFLQFSAPPETQAQQPPPPSQPWAEMIEKGRDMQMQYLASLQSILEGASKDETKR